MANKRGVEVRARIDPDVHKRLKERLDVQGISMSQAIRAAAYGIASGKFLIDLEPTIKPGVDN